MERNWNDVYGSLEQESYEDENIAIAFQFGIAARNKNGESIAITSIESLSHFFPAEGVVAWTPLPDEPYKEGE